MPAEIRIRTQDRARLDDLLKPMHEQIAHAHRRGPVRRLGSGSRHTPKVSPDVLTTRKPNNSPDKEGARG
jgi:hypothetical protein